MNHSGKIENVHSFVNKVNGIETQIAMTVKEKSTVWITVTLGGIYTVNLSEEHNIKRWPYTDIYQAIETYNKVIEYVSE